MRTLENILVTGGAGFIGSNLIRYMLNSSDFTGKVINMDSLTYAGNLTSLADVSETFGEKRYFFEKVDICDPLAVQTIFAKYDIDTVIHLAAESHVDRSIDNPNVFVQTNVLGTLNLLNAAKKQWQTPTGDGFRDGVLFHHVSTDEVYGSLAETDYFFEDTPYDPRSPYSASKASSDHLVRSFFHTYNLPITLSNCSNNYGPYQFPEKLIPVMIEKLLEQQPLPVYGDGKNIRDWLHVEDHNSAVWLIVQNGRLGESYNIGGENEWENIRLVFKLCEIMAKKLDKPEKELQALISYIKDRPGHDRRYAINCDKLKKELNWKQAYTFEKGLEHTVDWYLSHRDWIAQIKSGEYLQWIEKNYNNR